MAGDNLGMFTAKQIEIRMREHCPQAYALTANEAMRLKRIDFAIFQFFDAHREFIGVSREAERDSDTGEYTRPAAYHYIYNDESIALLLSTFKSKRINLGNAAKLAERVLNLKLFALDTIIKTDEDEPQEYALYVKEGYAGRLERTVYPEFYEVLDRDGLSNAEALRQALRLDEGYLYITTYEINILRIIKHISEDYSQPFTAPAQAGYIAFKSTPQTTALTRIGKAALDASRYDDSVSANLISAGSISVRVEGKPLSFDEAIACQQLQSILFNKAVEAGFTSPDIELTLDEFMRDRQLTDRKEALRQFTEVAITYYRISYEFIAKDSNGNVQGRYFLRALEREAQIIKGRGIPAKAIFGFGIRFFNDMANNRSMGYYPKGALALTGNAYKLGAGVWDDIRRNLGNGKREGHIKIATLLKDTKLPDANGMPPSVQRQRIIQPFFTALSKAAKAEYWDFTYTLLNADGKRLSASEQFEAHDDYNFFITCMIEVRLNHEPEYYTQLRQRNHDRAEAKALAAAAKVERDRDKVEAAAKRKASGKRKAKQPVKNET